MDRRHRLRSSRDFASVLRGGSRASAGSISVALRTGVASETVRVGFSIKAPNAVRRNRSKRLLRESFRPCLDRLEPGTDVVVSARRDISELGLSGVSADLHRAMARLGAPC